MLDKMKKRGQFQMLIGAVMAFVIIAVVLLVLFKINSSLQTGYSSTDTSGIYNATLDVRTAGSTISTNLPLLATIVVFSIVIAFVVGYFVNRAKM